MQQQQVPRTAPAMAATTMIPAEEFSRMMGDAVISAGGKHDATSSWFKLSSASWSSTAIACRHM